MQTVLDLLHFGLSLRAQVGRSGRPAQEEAHAGAAVDLDAHRAGHTVAAASAELAAQLGAQGKTSFTETIFENRYKYVGELKRMGAKITVEGKTAVIKGVRKLSGATVKSTDLRGGAALVTAGLIARGKTKVEHIEYILRGYENLDQKLRNLGASIEVVEG